MPEHYYPFAKLHSGGNSCVVILDLDQLYAKWQEISPVILHSHYGLGADQLMVVRESEYADFEVLGFDPDGTLVGMCGNGLRCTGAILQHWKHVLDDSRVVELVLEGRRVRVSLGAAPHKDVWKDVQVNLGKPVFGESEIPVRGPVQGGRLHLEVAGKEYDLRPLSLGNPHSVTFVEKLDLQEVAEVGALLEHHEAFPEGTSVEFVQKVSDDELRLGIWERSTGLAAACCSGTAAALVAAVQEGICRGSNTKLQLPGGEFFGSFDQSNGEVSISGEVVLLGDGTMRPTAYEHCLSKVRTSTSNSRRSELGI